MRKDDIETHADWNGPRRPAINVKVRRVGANVDDVVSRFHCDAETAERALEFSYEANQRLFWDCAQAGAEEVFGKGAKVYSEGRASGWLVVDGLPALDSWAAPMVNKWARFGRFIRLLIASLTSKESLLGNIEANEWAKPGSEEFNFVDTTKGPRCVADLKAEAIAAGFGPIVRR